VFARLQRCSLANHQVWPKFPCHTHRAAEDCSLHTYPRHWPGQRDKPFIKDNYNSYSSALRSEIRPASVLPSLPIYKVCHFDALLDSCLSVITCSASDRNALLFHNVCKYSGPRNQNTWSPAMPAKAPVPQLAQYLMHKCVQSCKYAGWIQNLRTPRVQDLWRVVSACGMCVHIGCD